MKIVWTLGIPIQKLVVYQWFSPVSSPFLLFLTELVGFEPTNSGVKVPCLTAWRQPIVSLFSYKYHSINVIFANLLQSALENDKVKYLSCTVRDSNLGFFVHATNALTIWANSTKCFHNNMEVFLWLHHNLFHR